MDGHLNFRLNGQMMDNQQHQQESEERERAKPQGEDSTFDPWEQAFKRDFQKNERDFEF